ISTYVRAWRGGEPGDGTDVGAARDDASDGFGRTARVVDPGLPGACHRDRPGGERPRGAAAVEHFFEDRVVDVPEPASRAAAGRCAWAALRSWCGAAVEPG